MLLDFKNKKINYLSLKIKIFHRKISDFGLYYLFIYPILFLLFYFIGKKIVTYDYGEFISIVLYVNSMYWLTPSLKERKWLFLKKGNFSYLILINLIITIPFFIPFILLKYYYSILFSLFFICYLSFYSFRFSFSILEKIDLSFLMKDFEFIEGVRRYWYSHLLGIIIIFIGFSVGNNNLAIFGYLIFMITFGYYYQKIEPIYWIWIFKEGGYLFLYMKIKSIIKRISIPSILFLIVYLFLSKDISILFIIFAVYIGIINSMLSKYAYIKNSFSIQISHGISLGILIATFFDIKLLLLSLIYFYFLKRKAVISINKIIENN